MKFKKIYSAANPTEAYFIEGLLKNQSIETMLTGENLMIAVGELPTDVFQIKVLVNEVKYTEALNIISNYEKDLKYTTYEDKNWKCGNCKNLNPITFELCWNCEYDRETLE